MLSVPSPVDRTAAAEQLIGRTLWQLQAFEETLARLIAVVFRLPVDASLVEARKVLDETRAATLGRLLRELRSVVNIDDSFEVFLTRFLEQRNWLVHRSWRSHRNYVHDTQTFIDLRYRVGRLGMDAVEFNEFFGRFMMDWASERGISQHEIEQLAMPDDESEA